MRSHRIEWRKFVTSPTIRVKKKKEREERKKKKKRKRRRLNYSTMQGRLIIYQVQKKFDDIFSHLDTIDKLDGQTDGRTDSNTALPHIIAQ